MKTLIVDMSDYREQSEREAQSARSEYLRRAERQEALRGVDWDAVDEQTNDDIYPIPVLIAAIVSALLWVGVIALFWLV